MKPSKAVLYALCVLPTFTITMTVIYLMKPTPQVALGAEPVKVSVYYETLCPDSIRFITEQLKPVFETPSLKAITKFDLVPYGKATQEKVNGKWEFSCQHGAPECQGNQFQTCAIRLYEDPNVHIPLIICMESKARPNLAGKECVNELVRKGINISYDAIEQCTTTTQGNKWQHEMADRTHNLKPTLYFVPWININDEHTTSIQDKALNDLKSVICDTYEGDRPASCSR